VAGGKSPYNPQKKEANLASKIIASDFLFSKLDSIFSVEKLSFFPKNKNYFLERFLQIFVQKIIK